jgi:hypothetical protein
METFISPGAHEAGEYAPEWCLSSGIIQGMKSRSKVMLAGAYGQKGHSIPLCQCCGTTTIQVAGVAPEFVVIVRHQMFSEGGMAMRGCIVFVKCTWEMWDVSILIVLLVLVH